MTRHNVTHGLIDADKKISRADPLNAPEFHSETDEIIGDLADLAQSQGPMADAELKSVIDEYIYQKISRGEMQADETSDDFKKRIFEEWKRREEEIMPITTSHVIR